jgi:tripartite-type tricarboxylate transporter receptor subunit TctC
MKRRHLAGLLASVATLGLPAAIRPARAQGAWPDRPVRFIIPFPAGGGTDAWGRMIAEAMQPLLGQPIVVENRAGGAGIGGGAGRARRPHAVLLDRGLHHRPDHAAHRAL